MNDGTIQNHDEFANPPANPPAYINDDHDNEEPDESEYEEEEDDEDDEDVNFINPIFHHPPLDDETAPAA